MGEFGASERSLGDADLPGLMALTERCLNVDGGLPLAAGEQFVRNRYLCGEAIGMFRPDGSLIAAAAIGVIKDARLPAAGLVDPAYRNHGLGRRLLDWSLEAAGDRPLMVVSENVTEGAERLYERFGLRPVFGELVMRHSLTGPLPVTHLPSGLTLVPWRDGLVATFFAAYSSAFADRPGFPHWTQEEWVEWTTDDEDFRPELSLLAIDSSGAPAAFLTAGTDWIEQMGVIPSWRRLGVGAAVLSAALAGFRSAGFSVCWLAVGTNNPAATALYTQSGFATYGRRGRYTSAAD